MQTSDDKDTAAQKGPNGIRSYFSILGFKIAVTVGFFLFFSMLLHLFMHEYNHEGYTYIVSNVTDPYWWGAMIITFGLLMIVLSKMFILPIKKLEMHINKIHETGDASPFIHGRKDEIGFLIDRFNSLQKALNARMELRDAQLSALNSFTDASAGVFDIHELMRAFFNATGSLVSFKAGAFAVSHMGHTYGRIYAYEGMDEPGRVDLTLRLFHTAGGYNREFPREHSHAYDVQLLNDSPKPDEGGSQQIYFVDLPVICWGRPIGVLTIMSASADCARTLEDSRAFKAMLAYAVAVMEKLFAHTFVEEKKLENILSSMTEGVFIIDKDGHAAAVNRKGAALVPKFCKHGCEVKENGGERPIDECHFIHGGDCEFSRLIEKSSADGAHGRIILEEMKNADGTILQFAVNELIVNGNGEGHVITVKDVTEERMMQKRVMLTGKLAALGEMAAGIAHEINNPLQVMMANLELLDAYIEENGRKRVDYLKDGIMRIKNIVKDLLIFAREQTTEHSDVNVNSVVEKVIDLIGRQLKVANVDVVLDLDKTKLLVKCNKNLFQQVLINLLQNAKDAIEEKKKGTRVAIRTALVGSSTVMVEVADDGPGIPEAALDRIFDPFFTTKDVGKGTGLGLSVSRRIIEDMGGQISVSSSPAGTVFTITLSLSKGTQKLMPEKAVAPVIDFACLRDKTVLIVDDEEGMIKSVKDGIGSFVGLIEGVHNGIEALDLLSDRDFDIVLLDIKMPGMSGIEFYKRLNAYKPYMLQRIIFLTGDTENESTGAFLKLSGNRFLGKPFSIKELLVMMSGEYQREVV